MTPLEKAISIAGSQSALAERMGIPPQNVNNWLRRGRVPIESCPGVEKAVGRQITCEELRPDFDWAYLGARLREAA